MFVGNNWYAFFAIGKRLTVSIHVPVFLGEALYAAVAGGYSTKQGSQASVEFMDLSKTNSEREWIKGPALPWELMEFSMITTPSGDGLLAVGGISGNNALYSS